MDVAESANEQLSRRLDTRLEAAGAEFLVLGCLLIEGIQAYKAYVNYPGYDLIATNPSTQRSCRIQVKSRWATEAGGFPIKNFDCDFVVYVALNRGHAKPRVRAVDNGKRVPDLYVFPVDLMKSTVVMEGSWSKVRLNDIPDRDTYRNRWESVKQFLD